MKTIFTLFVGALLSVTALSAQTFADADYVSTWNHTLNGATWFRFNKPVVGMDVDLAVQKKGAVAKKKVGLVPSTDDFEAVYATLGTANKFVSTALGADSLALEATYNDHGATDFTGEWKAAWDDNFLYVFVKYTDDSDYGVQESLEIMWSSAFKIDAPDTITTVGNNTTLAQNDSMALFNRYMQFGGYKAKFTTDGFAGALVLTGGPKVSTDPAIPASLYADGVTPQLLVDNLAYFNKTNPAEPLLKKMIVKIGFPAFTGEARPDFNKDIWNTLNNNRGLSFEITIKDWDADDISDPTKPADPTKIKHAGYFWNNAKGDVWGTNAYAGFLKNIDTTGLNDAKAVNSIFSKVTPDQIQLTTLANVTVYNTVGKVVLSSEETNLINLSSLGQGVYVIRANNETVKVVR